MPHYTFLWTDKVIQHLADNDVTPEEFEEAVRNLAWLERSRSSGLPGCYGWTSTGTFLFCIWKPINDLQIEPVNAFKAKEPFWRD